MADTRDDDRWDILVERYLEGRLFPSERAALRKRLAADPALRDRLVETVVQEAALRTIPLQEGAAAMEAGAAEIVRAAAARRLVRAAVWVAAAAAGALFVAGAFAWLGCPAAPVACLVRVTGDVFVRAADGAASPAQAGRELWAGEGIETAGGGASATVALADGMRLELGESTAVGGIPAPGSRAPLVVARGVVGAAVAPAGDGRTTVFATPHAELRVLGTRFVMRVSGAETRVEVTEGRVRLSTARGEAVVAAGRSSAAAAGAPPLPAAALAPLRPAGLFLQDASWRTIGGIRFKTGRAPGRDGGVLNVDFPGPAEAGSDRVAWICSHAVMEVQDGSGWDGIEFGFLGRKSDLSVTVGLHDTGNDQPKRGIDEPYDYTWAFTDDFEGWKTLRVPWAAFRKEPGRGGPQPFARVFGLGFGLRRFVPGGGCRIGEARLYKEKP